MVGDDRRGGEVPRLPAHKATVSCKARTLHLPHQRLRLQHGYAIHLATAAQFITVLQYIYIDWTVIQSVCHIVLYYYPTFNRRSIGLH